MGIEVSEPVFLDLELGSTPNLLPVAEAGGMCKSESLSKSRPHPEAHEGRFVKIVEHGG